MPCELIDQLFITPSKTQAAMIFIQLRQMAKMDDGEKSLKIQTKIIFFGKKIQGGRLTPYEVTYFDEVEKEKIIKTRIIFTEFGTTTEATKEIQTLFNGKKVFDTPKPTNLLKKLMQVGTDDDDIILDFFAGSGTTAHAVMAQNLEDGGNRKFILVQLDEKIDERNSNFLKRNLRKTSKN